MVQRCVYMIVVIATVAAFIVAQDRPSECFDKVDLGTSCYPMFKRWFFDPVRRNCFPFPFGCSGNDNNYFTFMHCAFSCYRYMR